VWSVKEGEQRFDHHVDKLTNYIRYWQASGESKERYAEQIAECRINLTNTRAAYQAHSAEMMEYEAEVLKVIRGESKLNSDLLNKLYEEAKEKSAQSEQAVRQLEEQLKNSEQMKTALSKQFDNIKTWSDMYSEIRIIRLGLNLRLMSKI